MASGPPEKATAPLGAVHPLTREFLLNGGSTATKLIEEAHEEGLHLDFKQLRSPETRKLVTDDRAMIGKALSGFANAEGGLIVIGIGTTRRDGLDVASSIQAVPEVARWRNRLAAAVPELLTPVHPAITVHAIPTDQDSGIIVVDIPQSDRRPHMSQHDHRYYRRRSDSTSMMEHGEVRDMMLAPRSASLSITVSAHRVSRQRDHIGFSIDLRLKNDGAVPAFAPFAQILTDPGAFLFTGDSMFHRRASETGGETCYTDRNRILPPGDSMMLGGVLTGYVLLGHGAGPPRPKSTHGSHSTWRQE